MGREDRKCSGRKRSSRSCSRSRSRSRRRNHSESRSPEQHSRSPRRVRHQNDEHHRVQDRHEHAQPDSNRPDDRRGNYGRKHVVRTHLPLRHIIAHPKELESPPAVGSIHRACVTSVRPFGVFVRPEGWPQDGLVHATQVSEQCTLSRDDDDCDKLKALEFFAPRHAQVFVKLTDIQDDGSGRLKLACSMKCVDQESGADLDPSNASITRHAQRGPESDEPPGLGTIHAATVERIQPFGVFVRLSGFRKWGLVHASQISDHLELGRDDSDENKTAALAAVVAVGESVQVKVVEVVPDERGPKVGCSMKLVNQRDGTDLDPNFLKYRPRGEAPGGGLRSAGLGSTAGQVKPGDVVDWGHLTGGDTKFVESRGYDLLDEGAGELPQSPQQGSVPQSQLLPPPPSGQGAQPAWGLGTGPGPPPDQRPDAWGGITSMEQALAILNDHKKKGKHDKSKKAKHDRLKKDKQKHKKTKHRH